MPLQNVINFSLPSDGKRFPVGLVGQGPALETLTRLLGKSDCMAAFPGVKIAGWAPAPEGVAKAFADPVLPAEWKHQAIFPDAASLFAACPDIALVIDLSPDSRHMEALRACAPAGVSIGSSDALLRFCAAAEGLRKAEKLFSLLIDQMDDDILILNEAGVILDANLHAGANRDMARNELIGKDRVAVDGPSPSCFDDEANCPFRRARKSGKQEQHTFARTLDSGRVRYIHALCFPVTDAFGGHTQYLYIRRDVTEQQQLAHRLQQAEKMAAIGELSTYMAHEIRNPLFSIGGFANALLRNQSLNDLAREKARIIYDESRRLDLILTSILNFARPTEQILGEFDVPTVTRQTLVLMTIGSDERGINVVTEIEEHLPKVRGNAENLKQCLVNLVKNAIEAMPDGGTLTLSAARVEGYVRIEVSDNGPGIPAAVQDQIFSPFFTTKHDRGAGLGLAMTRKLIDEMGGRVTLNSHPDTGTRVALLLPVALAVSGEAEEVPDQAVGVMPTGTPQPSQTAGSPRPDTPSAGIPDPAAAGISSAAQSAAYRSTPGKGPDEDPYA